ncbi:MAB_1171c family putative transporter [Streptomyces cyaneus]|uniref:MAB_1171c family putative transporter n=1 Tax=Streptomyces cyaneus TaxID=1904 RepID=UPI000FF889E1|nr:MAB_1171c family putative transporter [Streptomyces cyaneus]
MSTSELATQVGLGSVFTLWFALIWRARPALRQPHQRGLWLTVLAATIAITLFQPVIVEWLTNAGLELRTVALARNVIGVLSAGLVLLFMVDSTRTRHLRLCVMVGLPASMGSLLILGLLRVDQSGEGTASVQGPADAASAYWLILIVAHLVGDAVALVVCWLYSLRTGDRDLVWSLRLFAMGSVLAVVFWCGYLWHLYGGSPGMLPYLSLIMGVHGFIRAASLLVPTATALVRSWTALRTTWLLWPLWRDLVKAVPQVALARPQRTRLQEVLRPRSPLALQAHRQTIETYDAFLDLQRYVQPGAYEEAHRHARRAGVRADRLAAAAVAGVLGQARRAKLVGASPSAPCPLPGVVHGSPATLLGIARMWPSMADALPCHDRLSPAQQP